jgi:Fe-S cluster assembly protein SufD
MDLKMYAKNPSSREFILDPEIIHMFSQNKSGLTRRLAALNIYQRLPMPTRSDRQWCRSAIDDLQIEQHQIRQSKRIILKQNHKSIKGEIAFRYSCHGLKSMPPKEISDLGVILCSLADAEISHGDLLKNIIGKVVPAEDGKFSALTQALDGDGLFLYIPKGIKLEKPLHQFLELDRDDKLNTFHLLVFLEDDSSATFIQEWEGLGGKSGEGLLSAVVEIIIGNGASLDFVELQTWQAGQWNILHERAELHENSRINWVVYANGGRYSRSFLGTNLMGETAQADMTGIYLGAHITQLDFDTHQQHSARNTRSDLLFYGALANESRSDWSGMIRVERQAMKTDGYQANRNLILCGSPKIESIPGLEILADDVRCSHGVSVGEMEFDQLFYLASRGISENEGKQLIAQGFLNSGLNRVKYPQIKEKIEKRIQAKLGELLCE